MHITEQLASAFGRKDEGPNIILAQQLSERQGNFCTINRLHAYPAQGIEVLFISKEN